MRTKSCVIVSLLVLSLIAASAAGQSSSSRGTRGNAKVAGGNGTSSSNWPMYGRDLAGSHYNPDEKQLTPATVARLKTKWIFEAGADVSSQPVIVDGVLYFGSWDGKQYAVDAKTGSKIWEFEAGQR